MASKRPMNVAQCVSLSNRLHCVLIHSNYYFTFTKYETKTSKLITIKKILQRSRMIIINSKTSKVYYNVHGP